VRARGRERGRGRGGLALGTRLEGVDDFRLTNHVLGVVAVKGGEMGRVW